MGDIPRVLERIIHSLCQRIVQWVARLCHADATVPFPEQSRVTRRGILYPSVAVMNHTARIDSMVTAEIESLTEGD